MDDELESNYQLGRQLEHTVVVVEVEAAVEDQDVAVHVAEKIVVTNAATEATSREIVVAVDVAGNFHHLCLSTDGAKR